MSLEREVGEIHTKVILIYEQLNRHIETQDERMKVAENKIDNLRLWRAGIVGLGGIGAFFTALAGFFR